MKRSDSSRKDQDCSNTFFFTSVVLGAVRKVLQPSSVEADSVVGTDYSQLAKDDGKNESGKHLQVHGRMEQNRRREGWAPQRPVNFDHNWSFVQPLWSCIQQPRSARQIHPRNNRVSLKKPNKLQCNSQCETIRVQFLDSESLFKKSRKYYRTAITAGCHNHNYQMKSRELHRGLRSAATVAVRGGLLHLHVTCYTSCLIVSRHQPSKHISVWMKSARKRWTFSGEAVRTR